MTGGRVASGGAGATPAQQPMTRRSRMTSAMTRSNRPGPPRRLTAPLKFPLQLVRPALADLPNGENGGTSRCPCPGRPGGTDSSSGSASRLHTHQLFRRRHRHSHLQAGDQDTRHRRRRLRACSRPETATPCASPPPRVSSASRRLARLTLSIPVRLAPSAVHARFHNELLTMDFPSAFCNKNGVPHDYEFATRVETIPFRTLIKYILHWWR